MFTTYSASAGSGKTTHLVADYIALCLDNDSKYVDRVLKTKQVQSNVFHGILAITFTNNAAAEMKERIVKMLHTFAFESYDDFDGRAKAIYGMVVEQLFGQHPELPEDKIAAFIKLESLELLRSIIYDYARFTLTTIDSFFQRVIRSSALMLNLNLNYSVQIDLNEFYVQAIDQLINDLYGDKELMDRLMNMLKNAMEDSGKVNIDAELKDALKILYGDAEKNFDYLQDLQARSSSELKAEISQWRLSLDREKNALAKALQIPLQQIVACLDEAGDGAAANPRKFIEKLSSKPEDFLKDYKKLNESATVNNLRMGECFKKTFVNKNSSEAERLGESIKTQFEKVYDIVVEHRKNYLDSKLFYSNADKLLLFSDLQERMERIKLQSNFFILSEANTLIYKNIKDQDIPVIFDPIKFKNFFIDEFQDTSQMQWRDIRPLLENNALSDDGKVTLFGDVKQAIYRFRNGDVNLFYNLIDYERMCKNTSTHLPALSSDTYQNVQLQSNFRSSQSVVKFNNAFFRYYSDKLSLSDFYEDVEQEVRSGDEGLVQIYFKSASSDKKLKRDFPNKSDDIEAFIDDTESISVEDAEVLRAVVDAQGRGYAQGDIAILFSGNDKVRNTANLLMSRGYDVITEQSLSLDASPNVNLILSTMRYLLYPMDMVAQASVLFYLSINKEEQKDDFQTMLLTLRRNNDFLEKIAALNEGKTIPVEQWLTQPLYVLLTHIIDFYALDKTDDPFVVDFNNLILKYLQSHNGELSEFLNWWNLQRENNNVDSLTLPSGVDAITISTIHKSKGLEYPVVILPTSKASHKLSPVWSKTAEGSVVYLNLSKKSCMGSSYEDLLNEEETNKAIDRINLLYVAHTRAKDILYVIANGKKDSNDGADETGKDGQQDRKVDYGEALMDYVESSKCSSDQWKFVPDDADECVYYAGDRNWKKPMKKGEDKVVAFKPKMELSRFLVEDVAALCEQLTPESESQAIGNYVHDYLAKQVHFPQNMEEVEACIALEESDMKDRLRQAFERILGDEKLKPYFAPDVKVLNEITILDTDGREHRPDRVVFLNEEVVVLDYKTGQAHDSYQKQIDEYCNLLTRMGYENVRGELIYV